MRSGRGPCGRSLALLRHDSGPPRPCGRRSDRSRGHASAPGSSARPPHDPRNSLRADPRRHSDSRSLMVERHGLIGLNSLAMRKDSWRWSHSGPSRCCSRRIAPPPHCAAATNRRAIGNQCWRFCSRRDKPNVVLVSTTPVLTVRRVLGVTCLAAMHPRRIDDGLRFDAAGLDRGLAFKGDLRFVACVFARLDVTGRSSVRRQAHRLFRQCGPSVLPSERLITESSLGGRCSS